jgi:hypothetical protein
LYGVVAVISALLVANVVSIAIYLANTVCNPLTDDFGAARSAVRRQVPPVILLTGLVPAAVTVAAHRRGRKTWPWLTITVAWAAYAGYLAFEAEAPRYCVF